MVEFKVDRVEKAKGRKSLDKYFCKVYRGKKDVTREYCKNWNKEYKKDGTVVIYVEKGNKLSTVLEEQVLLLEMYGTRKEYLKAL